MKILIGSVVSLSMMFVGYVGLHPGVAVAEIREFSSNEIKPGEYLIDPAHSSVSFEIGHMGLAKVHGRFNEFAGKITLDEEKVTDSKVEFTVQSKSVDTAVPARDNHLRTKDFFDTEKYPTLKFVSTSVTQTEKGYVAIGNLTMLDVTKSVQFEFELNGPIDIRGKQAIGVTVLPVNIKRSDFGMNYGLGTGPGVSDEVTLRLSVEAVKS